MSRPVTTSRHCACAPRPWPRVVKLWVEPVQGPDVHPRKGCCSLGAWLHGRGDDVAIEFCGLGAGRILRAPPKFTCKMRACLVANYDP
jgi:hypothetical protein